MPRYFFSPKLPIFIATACPKKRWGINLRIMTKDTIRNIVKKFKWKWVFNISALFMLIYMLSVSHHYGISWDETTQINYGKNVLKFYTSGFKDTSIINEQYISRYKGGIHLYGGVVELISAVTHKITGGDEYNVHHFTTALFGFLAILFTGLTAKLLNGWRAALFALWFIFLSPVFFGHSMYNSKDIPFAASYIMSICFLIRFIQECPKPTLKTMAFLIGGIALSINIRIGGILLVAYTVLFFILKTISLLTSSEQVTADTKQQIRKSFLSVFIVLLLSYLLGLVFWPYGLINPLTHPLKALQLLADYDAFDSYNLFDGRWIHTWEIPWYYIPKWIWVTTPLFISSIVIILPLLILLKVSTQNKSKLSKEKGSKNNLSPSPFDSLSQRLWRAGWLWFFIVLFTALFPVFYIIIKKSNVYDGWRHALFVYPSLVVCSALLWDKLLHYLKSIWRYLYYAAYGVLVLFIADPLLFMVKNHPFESFYFSPLIGGINGAFKKFEIDYYGTSIKQAVEWIAENADSTISQPVRVRCGYGEIESCEHFVNKYTNLKYVRALETSVDWDYSIVLPVQAKADSTLLKNWPPKGTLYEVKAGNTPLSAIIKNFRLEHPEQILSELEEVTRNKPDWANLYQLGLLYIEHAKYTEAIDVYKKSIAMNPYFTDSYINLGVAFSNLARWDEAIEVFNLALKINPQYEVAKQNLQYALSQKALVKANPSNTNAILDAAILKAKADPSPVNFVDLSAAYYNVGKYELALQASEDAIRLQPNYDVAYNNICVIYYALNQWDKAIEAGKKGLEINPNNTQLRNNLNQILQEKNKK